MKALLGTQHHLTLPGYHITPGSRHVRTSNERSSFHLHPNKLYAIYMDSALLSPANARHEWYGCRTVSCTRYPCLAEHFHELGIRWMPNNVIIVVISCDCGSPTAHYGEMPNSHACSSVRATCARSKGAMFSRIASCIIRAGIRLWKIPC